MMKNITKKFIKIPMNLSLLKLTRLTLAFWGFSMQQMSVNAQVTFASAVNYGVGSNPVPVCTGDFNGDGILDLAIANRSGNNVSVLLGTGTGTFGTAINYGVGVNPYSVCTGDFNGDGKLDLATANSTGNNVSVLLGTGTGTFGTAVNYGVGTNPYSVCTGDFNGDGKLDLATANISGNNVSVLLGTGTGTFGTAINYGVGSTPLSVCTGDFNGDGKLDLTTANGNGNNVSVLLGTGTGTFGAAVNYGVGTNPYSVCTGDFNGDGKLDLATANLGSFDASVLLGTGTGTFGAAVNYGVGANPYSVCTGDFNGDGKLDLATANFSSNNASVLLGTGTGTFGTAVNYGVGTNPYSVCAGDFNGDGKLDLATANFNSNNASVLLNTSSFPGAALNFDGNNDLVTATTTGTVNGAFTVEAWVKPNNTNIMKVFSTRNASYDFGFDIDVQNGSLIHADIGNGSGWITTNAQAAFSYTAGQWLHIAYVVTNSGYTIYANGNSVGSGSFSGTPLLLDNLRNKINIGSEGEIAGGFMFNGSIDEVRVWNKALCQGQIQGNMNTEITTPQAGLVAYYQFNQGLAAENNAVVTTLTDASGSGFNGTLTNFALTGATSNWVTPGAVVTGSTSSYVPVSASISSTNVLCNGGSTGSATITPSGGSGGYTYMWSTGGTAAAITSQTAGVKTVTVTDANNCASTATVNITQPTALATTTAATSILCNGGSTGSATVTASGGTGAYSYMWSNGASTQVINGLMAGVYTSTVIDNNNCTSIKSVTVGQPSALATTTAVANVLCNGGSTGSATITAAGGTGAYSYLWSNGATTQSANGLLAGVYTATVTDANNCTSVKSATITQPTAISLSASASNATICSGSSSTLTANATGGTGAIAYSWVSGPTTSVSVVSPTTTTIYTVNVTDANSCAKSATVSVVANVCATAQALNFDGTSDQVNLGTSIGNALAGTNKVTIEAWVKPTTTSGPYRIIVGNYSTPANQMQFCIRQQNTGYAFFLGNGSGGSYGAVGAANTVTTGVWQHVSGTWDGSVAKIYINGVLTNTASITYPSFGSTTNSVVIGANSIPELWSGDIDEVRIWNRTLCESEIQNNMNGEIPTTASGLIANYHFNQGVGNANNSAITSLIDDSGNGNDGTLLTFSLTGGSSNWVLPGAVSASVTPFVAPSISVNSGTICANQSFTINPSGATTYSIQGGATIVTPTTNATYTVVGYINECASNIVTSSVTVNALPVITSQTGNVTLCGNVSSTHSVSVAGTNTYEWHFTEIGGTDEGIIDGSYTEINYTTNVMTIQQVLTGDYNGYGVYCVVTNSNNCSTTSMIDTIIAHTLPVVTVNDGVICAGQSFTMTPGGADAYTYSSGSNVVMPSANETYTVIGTDVNGCENIAISSITVNALPILTATTNNTLLCVGQTATLSVTGADSYIWSTAETTPDVAVSPTIQTTYTVVGTDANNCVNAVTITQYVSTCTGISSINGNQLISIFPNPNNGLFNIHLTSNAKVEVVNAIGQTVFVDTFDNGKHTINLRNEASGVYFVKVTVNNHQQIVKIIKE